jgi:tetratricopeptide (TPR) repeat protein
LRTDNFRVIGNARGGQLREIALKLEQFREAVRRASPTLLRDESAPPVVVLVFRDEKSYRPYWPHSNGRPVRVGGYFLAGEDVNFITMNLESADGDRTIFHEFSHLLTRNVFADAPLWFNEGLAEYYSSFEVAKDGRRAHIGKAIADHLTLLRKERLRLARFYAIDRNSAEYTKDTIDRNVLYAQSWAIVHHAFHGPKPERKDQLFDFAEKLARGGDTAKTFRETYGIELNDLEREVREYVQNHTYEYGYIDYTDQIVRRIGKDAVAISDAEADGWLGSLLARMGRNEEAVARLESALAAKPDLPQAHAALGMIQVGTGKATEGIEHLRNALAQGTDNELAHFAFGYALVTERADDAEALAEAQRALEGALKLRPQYTEAKLLLAHVYLLTSQYSKVQTLLAPVVSAEPGNHRAKLALADALVRMNDAEGARALAGPVMAWSTDSADRNRARTLLEYVARVMAARDGSRGTALPVSAPTDAASGARPDPPAGPRSSGSGFRLELRPLGRDEQRVYGRFESLECGSNVVVLVVRGADSVVRARAANLSEVQMVTFRPLKDPTIPCGAQNPAMEVYLTWRPPAADGLPVGTAIALEVLPEGFRP